jgi:hypothetical protein
MADMIMAGFAPIHLVTTQVAMAFGASVQPFTKMTPMVSKIAIKSTGELVICSIKPENDRSISIF